MVRLFVAVHLALVACSAVESAGGEVTEFIACPTDLIDCGHVYLCEQSSNNDLGHIEICIDDDSDTNALALAEVKYGTCVPTPRHQGLCAWGCPSEEHHCNAYNGCFCPSSAVNGSALDQHTFDLVVVSNRADHEPHRAVSVLFGSGVLPVADLGARKNDSRLAVLADTESDGRNGFAHVVSVALAPSSAVNKE